MIKPKPTELILPFYPTRQRISMIHLVERRQALQNANLKKAVSELQNAFYQDRLSLAENEEERQSLEARFDCREPQEKAAYYGAKTFYHPSSELTTYPKQLGAALQLALQHLGVAHVYCLSHVRTPLFGNLDHSYKPLKKAYQALAAITKDTSYREGFAIPPESVVQFTQILFWISRCDMAAPQYIFLNPDNDSFVAYLCKYGNLHVDFNQAAAEVHVTGALLEAGLQEWPGEEYDRFGRDGIMKGRRLKV
jgi:hypothetical protein